MASISIQHTHEVDDAIHSAAKELLGKLMSEFIVGVRNLEQQAIAEGRIVRRDAGGKPCIGCGSGNTQ
jgi:hypothetical protein